VTKTSFSVAEKWALNNYSAFLKQNLEDLDTITVKLTMARMILFEIRSIELSYIGAYKMAVDLIMPSFENIKVRNMFADVSSHFFTFYDGRTRG
jgi:hypothetical protein